MQSMCVFFDEIFFNVDSSFLSNFLFINPTRYWIYICINYDFIINQLIMYNIFDNHGFAIKLIQKMFKRFFIQLQIVIMCTVTPDTSMRW